MAVVIASAFRKSLTFAAMNSESESLWDFEANAFDCAGNECRIVRKACKEFVNNLGGKSARPLPPESSQNEPLLMQDML